MLPVLGSRGGGRNQSHALFGEIKWKGLHFFFICQWLEKADFSNQSRLATVKHPFQNIQKWDTNKRCNLGEVQLFDKHKHFHKHPKRKSFAFLGRMFYLSSSSAGQQQKKSTVNCDLCGSKYSESSRLRNK